MELKQTLITILIITLVIVGTYSMTGSPEEMEGGKKVLNLWHPWGGPMAEDFRSFIRDYNQKSKTSVVDPLYSPNDLSSNQKYFLSVAGGAPPEITFVDGPQVAEWAARGALEPLDDLMQQVGISNDDFWTPCVAQNQYKGKTYALTYSADPNFAFAWNKRLFSQAGLDPNRPPRTIEEVDQFAEKLTSMDEDGDLNVIGFIPWAVYGMENSLFTWGWTFGGSFYDPETNRITCNTPPILNALKWMLSYADKYDLVRINSFQQTFGTGPLDPFLTGKVAMSAVHVGTIRMYEKYKPDLEYGVAPMPAYATGEPSAWIGGWCVGIPKGARFQEESIQFMKWLCTSDEGTLATYQTTGSFPGYKYSIALEEAAKHPKKAVFLEILRNTKHQRPVMPAQAYYMGAIRRGVDYALNKIKSPEAALEEIQRLTQKELDRVEAQYGGRKQDPAS